MTTLSDAGLAGEHGPPNGQHIIGPGFLAAAVACTATMALIMGGMATTRQATASRVRRPTGERQ